MRGAALVLVSVCAGCTPSAAARTDGGDASRGAAPSTGDAGNLQPPSDVPADDALPPATSDDLTTRSRHLLEAIAQDDPALATDVLFPRDAYMQVKDGPDPGKQWDGKVQPQFSREVHALHKRTKGVERAVFVSFDIGEPVVQAIPKKHDLKRTLWRVRHSRLTFTVEGKAQHFDVLELTSWRGAWYVTKLRS